jgi:hypothetical protein
MPGFLKDFGTTPRRLLSASSKTFARVAAQAKSHADVRGSHVFGILRRTVSPTQRPGSHLVGGMKNWENDCRVRDEIVLLWGAHNIMADL